MSNDTRGLICLLVRLVGFVWIFQSFDWLWVVTEHVWTSRPSAWEAAPHSFHVKLICILVIFCYRELLSSWHHTYARPRALILYHPSTLISVPSIQLWLEIPCCYLGSKSHQKLRTCRNRSCPPINVLLVRMIDSMRHIGHFVLCNGDKYYCHVLSFV